MSDSPSVNKCRRCINIQPQLEQPTVFYVGESYKGILLVGESPHKSWLETGNPFVNSKGKLLPSAKNIQQYLKILGYTLDDAAVTEMVSCYVEDRKHLARMMRNCSEYVLDKITKANPTLVIILGHKTVQELSKVIGVDIKMLSEFKWNGRKCIALYHPSPINPKNNQRNLNFLMLR